MTRLNDSKANFPFCLKIVGEAFKETKTVKGLVKKLDIEEAKLKERLRAALDSVVTEARVRKLVHKMVDKGIIPENWGKSNLSTISKNISSVVYEDCLKEKPEIVKPVGNEVFREMCTVPAMIIVKSLLYP